MSRQVAVSKEPPVIDTNLCSHRAKRRFRAQTVTAAQGPWLELVRLLAKLSCALAQRELFQSRREASACSSRLSNFSRNARECSRRQSCSMERSLASGAEQSRRYRAGNGEALANERRQNHPTCSLRTLLLWSPAWDSVRPSNSLRGLTEGGGPKDGLYHRADI